MTAFFPRDEGIQSTFDSLVDTLQLVKIKLLMADEIDRATSTPLIACCCTRVFFLWTLLCFDVRLSLLQAILRRFLMILIIDLVILARLVNLLLISQLKIGSLASSLKSFSF